MALIIGFRHVIYGSTNGVLNSKYGHFHFIAPYWLHFASENYAYKHEKPTLKDDNSYETTSKK